MLDRIFDTPQLAAVVPQLQPELLHRVIQTCGLEDCGELLLLATPAQLTRIMDLDLWRSARAGLEEQFDADRFGVWLEVLVDCGDEVAAHKLAEMDADLLIAGLAQHARVFDVGSVTPYRSTDGIEMPPNTDIARELSSDVGGYRLVAKRTGSWEAIIVVLMALCEQHPDYFHEIMQRCRALSNGGREVDELEDLLEADAQKMYDVAIDREERRDEQGYVAPPQARAFLEMARKAGLRSETMPAANPIAHGYFHPRAVTARPAQPASPSEDDPSAATAPFVELLRQAGIVAQPPRALITGSPEHAAALRYIRAHMQSAFERDAVAHDKRNEELTCLANTLMSGCAVQGRSFTAQEAWDAAVAVCNLGLENWPTPWGEANDLVTVFEVGWAWLYQDAVMVASRRLLDVIRDFRCADPDVHVGLNRLERELSTAFRNGEPWRARKAFEVIAMLDMPAWAVLLGLISEFPVLHAGLHASRSRTLRVSATDFEFISENAQLTLIREFLDALPETLRP